MNEVIINSLIQLEKQAKLRNETFRARAFNKAQKIISKLPFEITNTSQISTLPGIGEGIIKRIDEILTTQKLQEVETFTEEEKIIDTFMKIHGVGFITAKKWYDQGKRSLDDLDKESLTKSQLLGVKYYEDLQQPIPREEIELLEYKLSKIIECINRVLKIDLFFVIAGSYRRGSLYSSDIDIILTERSGKSEFFDEVLKTLKTLGIIIEDLSVGSIKYLGIARIDSDLPARRIDFELITYPEFPFGLLYFTGSKNFNLMMRGKAKKMGMLLNHMGLYKNDISVPNIETEEDVFKILKLEYIPPEKRN